MQISDDTPGDGNGDDTLVMEMAIMMPMNKCCLLQSKLPGNMERSRY
jgi:hypothetical protein